MEKKYDGTHFLVMYLTGYAFYTYQVYVQLLYSYHGIDMVIPFIIAFLLLPLSIFFVCKKINKGFILNPKLKFVFTILSILYLAIVGLTTLNYSAVMIHNYYYQATQSYFIAFFLLIPIIYICFKNSKVYYSLAFVLFTIYLFFKFLYITNHEVIDLYPLYNVLSIDNPLEVIILAMPLFTEPIVLLSNTNFINMEKKINIKLIVPIACFISLVGIYTIIRQTMEFGLLLETISFPYFESCKFLSIKSNFDNIDYFYLFSIVFALFSRLPMTYFNIKDNLKLKKKGILIMFAITIVGFYYLHLRLEFYRLIMIPSLIICSLTLIVLIILSFFNKRRAKNDSQ